VGLLATFSFIGVLAGAQSLDAQSGTVSGLVQSAQGGQPLAATQIFIADLDLGGLSQQNGRYLLLNVPVGTHTVSAQRIGYRLQTSQVTVVSGQTIALDFIMTEEAISLDAVVVTGVAGGSQRRAVGNVVTRVDVGSIVAQAPIQQIEDLLIGRTPGVILAPPNGAGGGSKIRIRGHSSVGLSGDPIIYVDGVRLNDNRRSVGRYSSQSALADFDSNNIESIEIIKGPAAATLYGTEASDGVIQIITKRGQTGAPVVEVSTEFGANYWPDWEGYNRTTWTPDPSKGCTASTLPCTSEDQLLGFNLADHSREQGFLYPFQNGAVQRYNVAVRGGTDLVRYSFAVARSDQEGVVFWNNDVRNSISANIGVTVSDRLNFQISGQYADGVYSPPEFWWGGNYGWGGRPTGYFNRDGTVASCGPGSDPALCPNGPQDRGWRDGGPERYMPDRRTNFTRSKRNTWSLQANFDATDWLTHRATIGLDQVYERRETFVSAERTSFWHGTNGREGDKMVAIGDDPVWTFDFSGTATQRFMGGRLGTATSYGVQYYTKAEFQTTSHGEDFAIRALSTVSAAARTEASETFFENSTLGVYIQEQLDWDNRIFVTAAVRGDDNSAFGTNFDAAIYPKLSGAWVVHEEDFWNIDAVDQFRVRAAWGKAGRQPDVFAATRLFFPQTGPGGSPILTPDPSAANTAGTYGNPDLGPEVGSEIEVGFDASFFGGRVSTDFTYYTRTTNDAIIPQTIPPSLWAPENNEPSSPVQFVNVGQTSNWGTEIGMSIQAITEGPVRVDLGIAFTTQGNRIDDMGGIERIQVGRSGAHYEGLSIAVASDKRVISADFVDQVAMRGQVTNVLCDGGTGHQITRSDGSTYGVEIGGAPVPCADAPRLAWGPTDPTRIFNVSPVFTILDDWRLSANLDAQWGHWVSHDYATARYTSHLSAKAIFLQDDPLAMAYVGVTRNGFGYARAGFLKLREISLSYNLPDALTDLIGASSSNLRIGARNVARLWLQSENAGDTRLKYSEPVSDPEVGRPVYNFAGEDGGGWPPIPQWTIRLGMTF
jgi:TonB-dependent SusC/RagA subfamily outer membrane receptor